MKLLNIMALLLIKPRVSDQDNHFTRINLAVFIKIHWGINLPVFNKTL